MSHRVKLSNAVLRSSVLWGAAIAAGFYCPLNTVLWHNATVERYLAGHAALYLEALLFFIATAALAIRAFGVLSQFLLLGKSVFGPVMSAGQPAETCGLLLAKLAGLAAGRQEFYLVRRLREALKSVQCRGGAESLDGELQHLAARDRRRMLACYAPVWLILTIVPLIGLAATIALATSAASGAASSQSGEIFQQLAAGLAVAFDPTLLALAIVTCLLIALGAAIALELRLLSAVDLQAARELVGRFHLYGSSTDPHLLAVRRMADAVVQVTERLVQRQTDLWQSTIEAAHSRWNQLSGMTLEQARAALREALDQSLRDFAVRIAAASELSHAQSRAFWTQEQQSVGPPAETAQRPRDVLPFSRAETRAA